MSLTFYAGGDPAAPTVVLLHGASMLHRMWLPQLEPLSQRYHILAPDLFYDDLDRITLPGLAADVADLIRTHGGTAHVVGLSFGAVVATQLAIDAPDTIKSLVISAARVRADFGDKVMRGLLGLVPEQRLLRGFINTTAAAYPELQAAVHEDMARMGKRGFIALIRAMGAVDFRTALQHINTPTLVQIGALDRGHFVLEARTLADSIPGAQFQIIPDVGHGWNLEAPELYTEILTEFIDSVETENGV